MVEDGGNGQFAEGERMRGVEVEVVGVGVGVD